MQTDEIDLHYVDDPDRVETVVLHPVHEMISRRQLKGEWVTQIDLIHYQCWLAARRQKLSGSDLEFEPWLETIADFDSVLTERDISEQLAAGLITKEIAVLWRDDIKQRKGAGRGKSRTPRASS